MDIEARFALHYFDGKGINYNFGFRYVTRNSKAEMGSPSHVFCIYS